MKFIDWILGRPRCGRCGQVREDVFIHHDGPYCNPCIVIRVNEGKIS